MKLALNEIEKILKTFNRISNFAMWKHDLSEEEQNEWRFIQELVKESSLKLKIIASGMVEERTLINPPARKAKNKIKSDDYREHIKTLYNYRCIKCGIHDDVSPATIHHIKKIVDGGTSEVENLCLLCRPCHDVWHANIEPKGIKFWSWIECQ